jgi:hypothetical protein
MNFQILPCLEPNQKILQAAFLAPGPGQDKDMFRSTALAEKGSKAILALY